MAGAGYKAFADGDVLTAAQVQTYLQDQAVMRFADSSARTSGLGTAVAEGMVSYLQDTDALEVYDGSAWVEIGPEQTGVLQVLQAYVTTDQTVTATAFTDLTGSTVTITPASDSSKFLLLFTAAVEPTTTMTTTVRFDRGGTAIGEQFDLINDGTHDAFIAMNYLDAPGTASAVTYKMETKVNTSSSTFRSSSLTVMEVAS